MAIKYFIQKAAYFFTFVIFNLIFTVNAFPSDVPNTARGVLGRGYDLTGSYAEPLEIKRQVLDLNRLINENRVERNYNIERSSFTTAAGTNISEYTNSLATQTGRNISGGVNAFIFSSSFSREASNRFGSERTNRNDYEFATRSSNIIKGAFYIDDDNLTRYVNDSFINDINSMTPEQIISRYGTHVMLGALLGARLDYNMSVRRTRQTENISIENLVTTSFEARFRGIGGGTNHNQELQNRFGQMYDISTLRTDTKTFGGRSEFAQAIHNDPSPHSYDAWINSIDGNEVWIGYYPDTLVPLYEFITTDRFGTRARALRETLRNAIHEHLEIHRLVTAAPPLVGRWQSTIQLENSSRHDRDRRTIRCILEFNQDGSINILRYDSIRYRITNRLIDAIFSDGFGFRFENILQGRGSGKYSLEENRILIQLSLSNTYHSLNNFNETFQIFFRNNNFYLLSQSGGIEGLPAAIRNSPEARLQRVFYYQSFEKVP